MPAKQDAPAAAAPPADETKDTSTDGAQVPATTGEQATAATEGQMLPGRAWDFGALIEAGPDMVRDALAGLSDEEAISVNQITGQLSIVTKEKLIGVPIVVMDYRHNDSDRNPNGFWSVIIGRTDTGEMALFNDGGVGIAPVLEEADRRGHMMLKCPQGLRVSRYGADPDKGRPAGETYYFA